MKSARLQRLNDLRDETPAPERDAAWAALRLRGGTWERADGSIDSVQWVDLPGVGDLDLGALEPLYFAWVPRLSAGLVRPSVGEEGMNLAIEPCAWPRLIGLEPARIEAASVVRGILGGLLAHPGGSIGFERLPREEGSRLVVAVRALRPRLPRWLYFRVQAQLHERSTFGFLRRVAVATRRRPVA